MAEGPLDIADRCVKCGLCLPHCPTYQLHRNEADSPRGRIALIEGLLRQELPHDERLRSHLDGCLGCRACESVCPSGVAYGRLLDAAQAELAPQRPRQPWRRLTDVVRRPFLRRARVRRLSARLLSAYQATGMHRWIWRLHLARVVGLGRAAELLAPVGIPLRRTTETTETSGNKSDVTLFTGCFAELFDQQTHAASLRLLRRLGLKVAIAPTQVCCGAIDLHSGNAPAAAELAAANIGAFAAYPATPIITTASGCGLQLAEYGQYAQSHEGAEDFAARVHDISDWLATEAVWDATRWQPLAKRVVLHTPCTLRHIWQKAAFPARLLQMIPELELIDLPDAGQCCGAAGTHMLTHPEQADRLLASSLEAIERIQPDILCTSNTGCALHFRAGLRRAGLAIPVMHPVMLLEQAYV